MGAEVLDNNGMTLDKRRKADPFDGALPPTLVARVMTALMATGKRDDLLLAHEVHKTTWPTHTPIAAEAERVIDFVMESEKYAPRLIPMGANPPYFDSMQPNNDGAWVLRVDVASRIRMAMARVKL